MEQQRRVQALRLTWDFCRKKRGRTEGICDPGTPAPRHGGLSRVTQTRTLYGFFCFDLLSVGTKPLPGHIWLVGKAKTWCGHTSMSYAVPKRLHPSPGPCFRDIFFGSLW